MLFTFFKLYKWYQIAKRTTYIKSKKGKIDIIDERKKTEN